MHIKYLITGLVMAVALPATALAQPYDPGCVQQNHENNVAGTVVGGITGALLGGALTHGRDQGLGIAAGATVGAVAGHTIAQSNDQPCPEGYVYQGPPPPPPSYQPTAFWYGAPAGIQGRIDFMQTRINNAEAGGWVAPNVINGANAELNFIRSEDQRLHYQDGQRLAPQDHDYLESRLDALSYRLNWAQGR